MEREEGRKKVVEVDLEDDEAGEEDDEETEELGGARTLADLERRRVEGRWK